MIERQSETSRLLAQYLAKNDVCCPFCGYCLHGGDSNRCPECGHTFHLGLIQRSKFAGWWAASLFGVLLTALLTVAFLVISLLGDDGIGNELVSPPYGQGSPVSIWDQVFYEIAFLSFIIYGAGSGALAALLIAVRLRWADWPSRRRFIVSMIAISSPLFVPLTIYILYVAG